MTRLADLILDSESSTTAFIGLAKNAGKTTAFNQAGRELAAENLRLALLSYGRDGERFDAVTGKEKPAVLVPEGAFFVTAEKALTTYSSRAELVASTGFSTTRGEVSIYRCREEICQVELTGINRTSTLRMIRNRLSGLADFILVDGALDRRSSALPELAESAVISTGAVLGSTIDRVVAETASALLSLKLPGVADREERSRYKKLLEKACSLNSGGWLLSSRKREMFQEKISLNIKQELAGLLARKEDYNLLILTGALTGEIVRALLAKEESRGLTVIVRDGTRVFLNLRDFNLLKKRGITIKVLDPINILALTVNPHNPEGRDLDPELLLAALKESQPDLPVINVKSQDYYI